LVIEFRKDAATLFRVTWYWNLVTTWTVWLEESVTETENVPVVERELAALESRCHETDLFPIPLALA
jgi:hypothetical protein